LNAKSAISYPKKSSWAFKHSCPLKSSPSNHSYLVNYSVGITSSFSYLAFLLSVSLALLHPSCFLCFSLSWGHNCARLHIVATPVLTAAIKSIKVQSHGNSVHDVIIA